MDAPKYCICRSDPMDPTSALEFFPPKGSDELHEALKATYPHIHNLQARMRQAAIDFFLAEQVEEVLYQFNSPTVSDHTTPEYTNFDMTDMTPFTTSMSFPNTPVISEQTSPEYLSFSADSIPSDMAPLFPQVSESSQSASVSASTSPRAELHASVPTQEELTSVWALPSKPDAKIHKRRCMTVAEKQAYKQRRLEGACADCKRRRRKCKHTTALDSPTTISRLPVPKAGVSSYLQQFPKSQKQSPDFSLAAMGSAFNDFTTQFETNNYLFPEIHDFAPPGVFSSPRPTASSRSPASTEAKSPRLRTATSSVTSAAMAAVEVIPRIRSTSSRRVAASQATSSHAGTAVSRGHNAILDVQSSRLKTASSSGAASSGVLPPRLRSASSRGAATSQVMSSHTDTAASRGHTPVLDVQSSRLRTASSSGATSSGVLPPRLGSASSRGATTSQVMSSHTDTAASRGHTPLLDVASSHRGIASSRRVATSQVTSSHAGTAAPQGHTHSVDMTIWLDTCLSRTAATPQVTSSLTSNTALGGHTPLEVISTSRRPTVTQSSAPSKPITPSGIIVSLEATARPPTRTFSLPFSGSSAASVAVLLQAVVDSALSMAVVSATAQMSLLSLIPGSLRSKAPQCEPKDSSIDETGRMLNRLVRT